MSVVLTRSRALNALRAYVSYALSRFGSVRFAHKPLFVSVEPAAVCQLQCPACPVGLRNVGTSRSRNSERLMTREVWEQVLHEVASYAHTMQFYFQGEPLLNKDLPQMVREAHEAGLYTIVSTNAQVLTQDVAEALVTAGLDRIIVSMDGLTEESYGAYRIGGSLEKCKEALKWLQKSKIENRESKILIELQVLRLRTNEHEWGEFKRHYKLFGADRLVFKTAQLYDYADGHPLMPTNPKYSRYVQGADGHYRRRTLRKGCFRVWSGVVITTNGDVLPCCYDKAHAYPYGNIMDTPLADLFTNEKAMAFRQAAMNETPDICKECWK